MKVVQKIKEALLARLFALCALLSIFTTAFIILVLFKESAPFFAKVSLREFLTSTEWSPRLDEKFGIWPLACGTFLVAGGALVVAIPVGLLTAIFLSEYAPPWFRQIAKPAFEILAGVPSVVYGFFALTFITPFLLMPVFHEHVDMFNAASAAIVVGIMIIPTISSLCDDAFRAVPQSLREAAYGLSATKLEVSTRVVLPAALSGVVAAVLLGLARAIGETMAVALAAGSVARMTLNPLVSVQTMTGYIVQVSMGESAAGTIGYQSIFAVGLTLFLITFAVNLVAQKVLARFREAYE